MTNLSNKRREEIYENVRETIMAARVRIKMHPEDLEDVMFELSMAAPDAAVDAAMGDYESSARQVERVKRA